jgi:hypothetical protein
MALSTEQWLRALAAELGVREPTSEQVEALLALAGMAAHNAERVAAPLSCWLVGVAGVEPAAARAVAEKLSRQLSPAE